MTLREAMERIALGLQGRRSSGLRENEKSLSGGKPDWQLAQEALDSCAEATREWRQVDNPKGYAFIGFPDSKIKGVYVGGDGVAYVYDLPPLPVCGTSQREGG